MLSNEATLTVTSNQAPAGTITQPAVGALYNGGSVISYAGTATDPEDGTLPASAFTWRVDFHHDAHSHPFVPSTSGVTSGSFTAATTGHHRNERVVPHLPDGSRFRRRHTDHLQRRAATQGQPHDCHQSRRASAAARCATRQHAADVRERRRRRSRTGGAGDRRCRAGRPTSLSRGLTGVPRVTISRRRPRTRPTPRPTASRPVHVDGQRAVGDVLQRHRVHRHDGHPRRSDRRLQLGIRIARRGDRRRHVQRALDRTDRSARSQAPTRFTR